MGQVWSFPCPDWWVRWGWRVEDGFLVGGFGLGSWVGSAGLVLRSQGTSGWAGFSRWRARGMRVLTFQCSLRLSPAAATLAIPTVFLEVLGERGSIETGSGAPRCCYYQRCYIGYSDCILRGFGRKRINRRVNRDRLRGLRKGLGVGRVGSGGLRF